ncbi:Protein GLUTAMINE DUMPER 3 [Orobanche hederae]
MSDRESTAAAPNPNNTFSPAATVQSSHWHSPVPFLLGGLAAMLGLVAFALLVLACSYWKLAVEVNRGNNSGGRDVEKGDGGLDTKATPVFGEKLLVIMAGDVRPTFLATPTSSRDSFFSDEKTNNPTLS